MIGKNRKPKPAGFDAKISAATKGKPKSEAHRRKLSEVKRRLISSGQLDTPFTKPDYTPWNKGKTLVDDPRISSSTINIRKAISAQHPSPSDLEQRVFALVRYFKLPFDFTGDSRSLSIGGRFPDFIHRSQKVVLEVADKHEKEFRKKISWQQYELETFRHYSFHGWQCILLWSDRSDMDIVVKILSDLKLFKIHRRI